jgi:hypothetical protein
MYFINTQGSLFLTKARNLYVCCNLHIYDYLYLRVYEGAYMLPNSTLIPEREYLEQIHHVHLGINLYCPRHVLNTLKGCYTNKLLPTLEHHNVNSFLGKNNILINSISLFFVSCHSYMIYFWHYISTKSYDYMFIFVIAHTMVSVVKVEGRHSSIRTK